MQLSQDDFDVAEAHPLASFRRAQLPPGNRVTAALVTIAAHIAVIVILVMGISVARAVHQPAMVMVHLNPEQNRPRDLPPPSQPVLTRPALITVPVPQVVIAPAPASNPIAAAPAAPTPPAASAPSVPPAPSYAAPTWQGLLLARLEQAKRYPEAARFHGEQGVAWLRFTMDRNGKVLSARIEKSSGHDSLDDETLTLIQRAQPLPRPPADVPGAAIELVVPIEFYLNGQR